jgi:putative membrane protein
VKNWIMRWVASTVALLLIVLAYWEIVEPAAKHFSTRTTPGIWVDSPTAVLMAVLALGLANSVVRPIILFFAWPINCLTFGLFSFALNALLFLVVGNLGFGFHVNGVLAALIGSLAMGFLSGMINFFLKDRGEDRKKNR